MRLGSVEGEDLGVELAGGSDATGYMLVLKSSPKAFLHANLLLRDVAVDDLRHADFALV